MAAEYLNQSPVPPLYTLMMQPCSLLSLATAVPPHVVAQSDAKMVARDAFGGKKGLFERVAGVFDIAGIAQRHIVAPLDWYTHHHGWHDRNAVYLEAAEKLFVEAAAAAIEKAGLRPREIDGIVTVSTTGIATPSLEARVAQRVGFREDVRRVPVFGLGCAGGVNGLSLAARLAAADPGTRWLFVTVETCSISIRLDSDDPAAVVATALFGDGAAAAVVTAGEHSDTRIVGSAEKLWPETLRIMGWRMDPQGFGAIFSQRIPDFVTQELRGAADGFLGRNGLDVEDIDQYVFHPGGAKVIAALEQAFHLDQGTLELERQILADHGNMSAPTVLFVLKEALKNPFTGRRFLSALGPGFTSSFATMVS
jgi:alkylresorcinol/alkylpyrone synthase